MLNSFYNFVIIMPVLFFLTKELNFKYFKLNNQQFATTLVYHLCLGLIFIFILKDKTADYTSYVNLQHMKPFSFRDAFISVELIYNFVYILKKLNFNDSNIILVFSLISYFGILVFIKNLIKLGIEKKIAYLIFFIPGIHIWTSLPGKDCLIFFSLSFFFYSYLNKKFLFSIFFIIIIFLIRPHIGLIFILSMVLAYLFSSKLNTRLILLTLLIPVLFYLIVLYAPGGSYMRNTDISSENTFIRMLGQLHIQTLKFANTNSHYADGYIITNMLNYILFPISFIYKSSSLSLNISIIIEILTLVFLTTLIINQKKTFKIDKKITYFLCFCTLIYLLILPQVFFNYGLNSRQKWMIIPFLIYLIFLLKNLFVILKKK